MRRHGNSFRDHLAKRDVHRVRIGQKYWRFKFSEAWGPLLTDEWGEPVDNTPLANEEHPFWDAFEAWLAAHDARHEWRLRAEPISKETK